MELSQVIFGVRDLDAASEQFREWGFDVLDGGVHPGVGTANRVIPLGHEYLELLGVVAPDLAATSEYGRALSRATADGDRIVRWSLRTEAIDDVAARLGIRVEPRKRVRPDGRVLTWRAAGLEVALADGSMPFFMQWDRAGDYPGLQPAAHANGARRVSFLSVTPERPERFLAWTEHATAPVRVDVAARPGANAVGIETASGEIVVRAEPSGVVTASVRADGR